MPKPPSSQVDEWSKPCAETTRPRVGWSRISAHAVHRSRQASYLFARHISRERGALAMGAALSGAGFPATSAVPVLAVRGIYGGGAEDSELGVTGADRPG